MHDTRILLNNFFVYCIWLIIIAYYLFTFQKRELDC